MVSFGLVTIPVKLYSTGDATAGIQLNMLHAKCGSRLKQQYVCPLDEEIVGRDEMVKGYEYSKGQYVLFSEDELKALTREATNAINIAEFVPLEQVDPIYFEKSYYLGPDKGGERPYRLLAEAMKQTSRAALARYAARGKDYLVLLRPFGGGLIMQQLRYYDELRPFSEVPIADAEVREPELKLAKQIIDQIASDQFRPEAYEDEVRQQTLDLIEKKVAGQDITTAPVEAPKAQIIDLMAALKASLNAAAPSTIATPATAGDASANAPSAAAPRRAAGRAGQPSAAAAGSNGSNPVADSNGSAGASSAETAAPISGPRGTVRAPRTPRSQGQTAADQVKPERAAAAEKSKRAEPAAVLVARKPPKASPRTSLHDEGLAPAQPRRKDSKR
jgi:DNA end-binding protein Ku